MYLSGAQASEHRSSCNLHVFDVFLSHRGWIDAVQIGVMLSVLRMCIRAIMAGVGSEVNNFYERSLIFMIQKQDTSQNCD